MMEKAAVEQLDSALKKVKTKDIMEISENKAKTSAGHIDMQPAGASADIVRSGHLELNPLWASNDSKVGRQPVSVNMVNAPNASTIQCGCDMIGCPMCNLMLSIEKSDMPAMRKFK